MALAILDGTQTATTLSTILSSGQHITAHTVVSLGTQAKTDILSAVSSGIAISGTVTANVFGKDSAGIQRQIATDAGGSALVIASGGVQCVDDEGLVFGVDRNFPISGTVTVGNTVTIAGTVTANPTGTQTIAGTVSIGNNFITIGEDIAQGFSNDLYQLGTIGIVAGTAQIGSVTASISNSVTIASLPAISGTVTANIAISSTAITSGSFASLTSATLVPGNVARKMATVYNLGAGQLFVNAGSSATTLGGGFMVALSSGDYFECDYTTTTLSAIFATAGTASWMSH